MKPTAHATAWRRTAFCLATCLAGLLANAATARAYEEVSGELVRVSNRGVTVRSEGGVRSIPFDRSTSYSVSGRAEMNVLRPGMIVAARGKVQLNNIYVVRDATLSLYLGNRPTKDGFDINTQNQTVKVTGIVVRTNPLSIRADPSCMLATVRFVGNRTFKYTIRGRVFQLVPKEAATIPVDFGKNLRQAGKSPKVRVVLNRSGRAAVSVQIRRSETLTASAAKQETGNSKSKKSAGTSKKSLSLQQRREKLASAGLEKAKATLKKNKVSGVKALERLVKRYPQTEAAEEAARLLKMAE